MHATLAIVFLASLVVSAPFTYTSGVERGPQLTRIQPGNIEHVRSLEKTDKNLFWNPMVILPKERFVLVNPTVESTEIIPKEESIIEGKQQFVPIIHSKSYLNPEVYRPIRANPIQSGWLSVKPEHTEGLFHFSGGVKADAMQQSQQLESGKYGTDVFGKKKSGVRKFEAFPGHMEFVRADALQQSQQLEGGKYEREEFINPRSGRAGWLKVEPEKTEGLFKMDALQQSQQLEGRPFTHGIEYNPTRAGWLRVEPSKTEGVFKMDQMPIKLIQLVPLETNVLNPTQPRFILPIRIDAMQQHHQLDLEGAQQGQQFE